MAPPTLSVAVLYTLSMAAVWPASVTLANDPTATTRPCYTTTLPFQMPDALPDTLDTFADNNALNYGDEEELVSQLAIDEQIIVNRTSSAATAKTSSGTDVGLLPGLLATLQRRIRASLRATSSTTQQQQQQQSSQTQQPQEQQQTTTTTMSSTGKGHSLLPRLTDVLARYGLRLPSSVSSQQTNDLCSRDNADRMKQYCLGLTDGNYFDPWNPWCGYVECRANKSMRRTCPFGLWMGVPVTPDGTLLTQVDLCRVLLPSTSPRGSSSRAACWETTTQANLCRQTEPINSVSQYVDPAEDLQSSLSDLFAKKDETNLDKTTSVS